LRWQGPDHSDQVALALGIDLEHAKAAFLVEKSDVRNQAGQAFGGCRRWSIHRR
jgi:hypothetical protein